jgi:hypothetical protein
MLRIKMFKNITAVLIISAGLIILSGCFFGTPVAKTVTPIIRIIGAPVVEDVESITLTVSGPDIEDIVLTDITPTEDVIVNVPLGNDIIFELLINTFPASAITSYTGTSSPIDLNVDSTNVTVNIVMSIERTRIVVPDAENNRIVQIDDMTGAGWSILTYSDLGLLNYYDFIPYDIDTDEFGNIYIANNSSTGYAGGIYKVNSVQFSSGGEVSPTYFNAPDGYAPISAVAIDQKNSRVYGMVSSEVFYWGYDGLPIDGVLFFSPSAESIEGLAVDIDGNVYVSGQISSIGVFSWIGKYSSTGIELATYTGIVSETITDITILNNELYATKTGGVAKIERFDLELNLLDSYGSSGSEGVEGEFVGPHNFVAVMNKKLTIIDGTDYAAQLVSIDDINGTNWATYGSWDNTGDGTGVFKFFSNC